MAYTPLSLHLPNHNIDLKISHTKFDKLDDNTIILGYYLNPKEDVIDFISADDHSNLHKKIKGSWAILLIQKQKLVVITDILGGSRLYYSQHKGNTIITDDYKVILENDIFKKNCILNKEDLAYWENHKYTVGNRTFFNNLNKFPPCSISTFYENNVKIDLVFKDLNIGKNKHLLSKAIDHSLEQTFKMIKKLSVKKNILMFSGGLDSLLLAHYLKKNEIDFTGVFLYSSKISDEKEKELIVATAKNVDIKLEILNCELHWNPNILDYQLFDRHTASLLFSGIETIKEKFGSDICIINGQSSDSIFSYGPSEYSVQSFFRRYVLYKRGLFASISKFILEFFFKKKFSFPENKREDILSFLTEKKYCYLVDENSSQSLNKDIEFISQRLDYRNSYRMYAKIYSFLQGSDNQVVHNACKHSNIRYLCLPFADSDIIYNTVQYKDDHREIFYPKYVIKDILKSSFNVKFSNLNVLKLYFRQSRLKTKNSGKNSINYYWTYLKEQKYI
ncbi:hypothetical protein [Christiangramia aquimixticola]|uniref:hypothetical protein n=1 Tax=Christiangramia aquimixticola TaxID=1697558 RepID=UPI003AA98CD3